MKKVVATLFFALIISSLQSQAWTINADFENGSVGADAQGNGSSFSDAFSNTVYTRDVVHSGAQAAEVSISSGETGFGKWGGIFQFPSDVREGDEIWFRTYLYFPSGFNFTTDSGYLKTMRLHTASSGGSNEGYLDLLISGGGSAIAVGSEVTNEWYRNNRGWRTLGDSVPTGKWHAFEQYAKFSSTPGQAITRVWQNGKLVIEDTITPNMGSSSSISDFVYIFSYWNGGAPKSQKAYIDDVVITTERPGQRDENGNVFVGLGKASSAAVEPPAESSPPISPDLRVAQ